MQFDTIMSSIKAGFNLETNNLYVNFNFIYTVRDNKLTSYLINHK